MKRKHLFTFFFIIALVLTSLGYIVDKDPAYPQWTSTCLEFFIITLVIFASQSAVYGIIISIRALLSKK